jgi:hypothetical protein
VTVGKPATRPEVSGLARMVAGTGNALAKMGLFGGLAIGGGLGLAATFALGASGLAIPLVGAALLGFEGADANAAQQALTQGISSPAFQERAAKNRSMTPATAGAHLLSLVAASGAFGLGLGAVGGLGGMAVGVVGSLLLAGAVLHASSKAEKAILAASKG